MPDKDPQDQLAPYYEKAKEQEGLDADFRPRGDGHQPVPAFGAAVSPPCGDARAPIRLNSSSGLVADGYQGEFPAGTRCVWEVPPLPGAQLHLSLHLVDLPPPPHSQREDKGQGGEAGGGCSSGADTLRIRVSRADRTSRKRSGTASEGDDDGGSALAAPGAVEVPPASLAGGSGVEYELCRGSRIPPQLTLPRGAGVELSLSASLESLGTAQLAVWVSVQHPLAHQEFVERVAGTPVAHGLPFAPTGRRDAALTHTCPAETPLRTVVPSRPPKQRQRWLALRRPVRGGGAPASRGDGLNTVLRSALHRLVGRDGAADATDQASEPLTYTVQQCVAAFPAPFPPRTPDALRGAGGTRWARWRVAWAWKPRTFRN